MGKKTIGLILIMLVVASIMGTSLAKGNDELNELNEYNKRLSQELAVAKEQLAETTSDLLVSKKEIEELKALDKGMKYDRMELYAIDLTEEMAYYGFFMDRYLNTLSFEEKEDAKKLECWYRLFLSHEDGDNWVYQDLLNGEADFVLSASDFSISFTESLPIYPITYDNYKLNEPTLDHFENHITMVSADDLTYDISKSSHNTSDFSDTVIDLENYKHKVTIPFSTENQTTVFKDVKDGTVIELEISDELQERLMIDIDTITLTVNY